MPNAENTSTSLPEETPGRRRPEPRAFGWPVFFRRLEEPGRTVPPTGWMPGRLETRWVWSWTIGRNDLTELLGRDFVVGEPSSFTAPAVVQTQLERQTGRLFRAARDLYFEDGMHTPFSRDLIDLVKSYGRPATDAVRFFILSGKAGPEVSAEALRWLGAMDDPPSHVSRRLLLERCLWSPSAMVRDGAALGLAAMDDPGAIPSLRGAIEHEKRGGLREDLTQVLSQLEG